MKVRSNLVKELRKSLRPGMFADQVTAQTNKLSGMRISRSTAPGPSNTVDQAVWRAKYAACVVDWNALTPEQQAAYQAAADLRQITAFNQFMSMCLLETPPPPDYEDFTTFDEYDVPGDYLLVEENKITVSQTEALSNWGVVEDYGAEYFGDFEHRFEIYVTSKQSKAWVLCYIITNKAGYTYGEALGVSDGYVVYTTTDAGGVMRIRIKDLNTGNTENYLIQTGTHYYVKFKRVGTDLYVYLYSDDTFSTLITTLHVVCESEAKRYIYAVASVGTGTYYTGNSVAYIKDLNLV